MCLVSTSPHTCLRWDTLLTRTLARHTSPIQEEDRGALQRYPGAATTGRSLGVLLYGYVMYR